MQFLISLEKKHSSLCFLPVRDRKKNISLEKFHCLTPLGSIYETRQTQYSKKMEKVTESSIKLYSQQNLYFTKEGLKYRHNG